MSRGLILAGLAGGLSTAASNFDQMMMNRFAEDRRDAREEARDMRRLEAEDQRAEARKQQMIQEIAAARAGAEQMGRERMAGQVLAASRSMMDSDSPFMETMGDPTELANILRENPQAVEAYRQAGLIEDAMDPRLQRATDQYEAAAGAGASSATLEALERTKKSVLDTIRQEQLMRREDRQDRREDERERSNRAMEELRQQQLELTAKTQALRDSRQSAQELRTSYTNHLGVIETLRKSIQSDRNALQNTHKNELASARPSEREAVRARHRQEMARFDPMLQRLNSDIDWIRGQLGMSTGSSNSGDNTQTADRPPLDSFMRQQ